MIERKQLQRLSDCVWQIPVATRSDMLVPAVLIAHESMLDDILCDRSIDQLINTSTLPGVQQAVYAIPDIHEGYGFPIGGVVATLYPDGVISPGGIGYDINCGVRLLVSSLTLDEVRPYLKKLAHVLYRRVPSGVGKSGTLAYGAKELDRVLREGARSVIHEGYGTEEDLCSMESFGVISHADPSMVSEQAKKRGRDQLGTLGSGNHFVEVDVVERLFDDKTAALFNLRPGQIVFLVHTGSRGLGHQVATDYIRILNQVMPRYGIRLPDKELACVPLSSSEGTAYFAAMAAAANFAFANRQMITHEIRQVWQEVFGSTGGPLSLLYDVSHNMAKIEEHSIEGQRKKLIVHRKGATRSFAPHHPELPEQFKQSGQPVIIPGSMGTSSYILAGSLSSDINPFASSCHGAGRRLSRHQAKKQIQGQELLLNLEKMGIAVETGSLGSLPEEAPFAYKNVDDVVDTVSRVGIAKKVAQLKPLIVVKG